MYLCPEAFRNPGCLEQPLRIFQTILNSRDGEDVAPIKTRNIPRNTTQKVLPCQAQLKPKKQRRIYNHNLRNISKYCDF